TGGLAGQRQVALETEPVGGGGRHPAVVRLGATAGDERVAAEGESLGAEVLELAGLVATEGQTGLVVPFHEETGSSQPVGQAVERLDGGRPLRQRQRGRPHPRCPKASRGLRWWTQRYPATPRPTAATTPLTAAVGAGAGVGTLGGFTSLPQGRRRRS